MAVIKGHDIKTMVITTAFNRKALQFSNSIIKVLKKIGVDENDVEIHLESIAMRKAKASATWYFLDHRMHYSYNLQKKFVDNLYVVFKVIEVEVGMIISKKNTPEEFILHFKEDKNVESRQRNAREFFDLEHDETDFEVINKKYKDMAKILHPDTPTGDTERFKQLNDAHKILKRELT